MHSVMNTTPVMYEIRGAEYPISTTIVTIRVMSGSHVSPAEVVSKSSQDTTQDTFP